MTQSERHLAGLSYLEWMLMVLVPAVMVVMSRYGLWSIAMTEVLGFATGGVCVWLVVREHIWNWPIGLANNAVFFVLFLKSGLYADMGLQVVYFGFGVWGWWSWLHGGNQRTVLQVSRATSIEWMFLIALVPVGTWVLREILLVVNGAAPFADSLTTVLSLAAQYLLCRKRFENWFFWIAADVIYVPLYISRDLPLTALLYGVLLLMCLAGVREWHRSLRVAANRLEFAAA